LLSRFASSVWVDEDRKEVSFVTIASLKIALNAIEVNDDYWDQLSIDIEYEDSMLKSRRAILAGVYPGYSLKRVSATAHGPLRLSIPSAGIDETLVAKPGVEGPYIGYLGYLSKQSSQAFRAALLANTDGAITVSGLVQADFTAGKIFERYELSEDVCDALVPPSATTGFDLLKGLFQAYREVDAAPIRRDSTRASLKRSILESCFEIEVPKGGLQSADDLLSARVRRTRGRRPVGVTQSSTREAQVFPLPMIDFRTVDGREL
jgi:hypothetical protein